ncbi:unnamed protein product, partial [Tetraodon nigroviridis]
LPNQLTGPRRRIRFLSLDGGGRAPPVCAPLRTPVRLHLHPALAEGQGAAGKCPQCNKKAKRSDIVLLYAPKLKALDNTEQESLKKSLEQEQSLRRKAELESAQYKLKLQVVANKYGRAQEELQELKALIAGRGSLPSSSPASSFSSPSSLVLGVSQRLDGSRTAQYSFSKAVLVSQGGGCRVLAYCEPLSCLLASQPSPHSTLLPGQPPSARGLVHAPPLRPRPRARSSPPPAASCTLLTSSASGSRIRHQEGERGEHEGQPVRPRPQQADPRTVLQRAAGQPAAVCCPGQHRQTDQVRTHARPTAAARGSGINVRSCPPARLSVRARARALQSPDQHGGADLQRWPAGLELLLVVGQQQLRLRWAQQRLRALYDTRDTSTHVHEL